MTMDALMRRRQAFIFRVPHFLALSPIPTGRRMASERKTPLGRAFQSGARNCQTINSTTITSAV
jgi:hypothetical protein